MGTPATGPGSAMHVVAIQHQVPRRDGRPALDDQWVREQAEAGGVTFYELRARLRVLDGWPGVLATYAGAPPAEAVAAALRARGITAWVRPGESAEPRVYARQFSRQGDVLQVRADDGVTLEIPAQDVRMLVHGVQMGEDRDMTTSRPVLSPMARSALWVAPSLGLTRPQLRVRPTREPFVELHAPGVPIVSFRAASLHYAALDDGVVEPTRTANFKRVIHTLRSVCSRATYDARLRGRSEQMRVLGPSLRPEKHLSLALALITGQRRDASPYR